MNIQLVLSKLLKKHSDEIEHLSGQKVIEFLIQSLSQVSFSVDWSLVDEEIKFIAMDKDGGWRGYTEKPYASDLYNCWVINDNVAIFVNIHNKIITIENDYNDFNWKETLQCRELIK